MPVYLEHHPPAALDRHVECVWSLSSGAPLTHEVAPDGCIDIVYQRGSGLSAVGTMTRQQTFTFAEPAAIAGIRFRPGMASAFLRIPPSEIADRNVALEDKWARDLCSVLDGAKSLEEFRSLILPCFRAPQEMTQIQRAIAYLTKSNGHADLDWTASQANLSPRHFRRLCIEATGISPKHLCRILRFRHASGLAAHGVRDWCAIAAEAGYFDQSHLIRDFREFTGQTPLAVFSNTGTGAAS